MNISRRGQIDMSDVKYVGDDSERRVCPGDVLFNNTNSPVLVGKTAYVTGHERLAYSNHMTRLRAPAETVDGRFLAHQLHSYWANGYFKSICSNHVNQASVASKRLLQVEITVPPLEEQRRIVDSLESHISRLDAAEAALESASRRATLLSIAYGMQAISGVGLTTTLGSLSFGDQEMSLPHGWQASTVGDQASLVHYGTSSKTSELAGLDTIPVLRMGNIQRGTIATEKLKYLPRDNPSVASLLLERGDLLFNRTNSAELVGKAAVFDQDDHSMTFASYLIRVRFRSSIRPAWANLIINSPLGRAYVGSVASQQVGQANVNGTKLKAFPLAVPPLDVQDRLLARFEAVNEICRRLAADVADGRQRTASLRRSLLQAAFSGRLTRARSDLDQVIETAG